MANAWRSASKRLKDLLRIHPGLHHLERYHARDRLALFRHPDRAKTALPDLLAQHVRSDLRAFLLRADDLVLIDLIVAAVPKKESTSGASASSPLTRANSSSSAHAFCK